MQIQPILTEWKMQYDEEGNSLHIEVLIDYILHQYSSKLLCKDWQSNYKILCSHFYVESKTVNLQKYRVHRWLQMLRVGVKWGGTDQREQTFSLR